MKCISPTAKTFCPQNTQNTQMENRKFNREWTGIHANWKKWNRSESQSSSSSVLLR